MRGPQREVYAPSVQKNRFQTGGNTPSLGCPRGPKKERKKEMGDPRSQHVVLESRDIESVTRREGRWGFSKVYPWNGRIQP